MEKRLWDTIDEILNGLSNDIKNIVSVLIDIKNSLIESNKVNNKENYIKKLDDSINYFNSVNVKKYFGDDEYFDRVKEKMDESMELVIDIINNGLKVDDNITKLIGDLSCQKE